MQDGQVKRRPIRLAFPALRNNGRYMKKRGQSFFPNTENEKRAVEEKAIIHEGEGII